MRMCMGVRTRVGVATVAIGIMHEATTHERAVPLACKRARPAPNAPTPPAGMPCAWEMGVHAHAGPINCQAHQAPTTVASPP